MCFNRYKLFKWGLVCLFFCETAFRKECSCDSNCASLFVVERAIQLQIVARPFACQGKTRMTYDQQSPLCEPQHHSSNLQHSNGLFAKSC